MTNEKDSKGSATNASVSSLHPSIDQDAALLASLGYKQGVNFPNTNDLIRLLGC